MMVQFTFHFGHTNRKQTIEKRTVMLMAKLSEQPRTAPQPGRHGMAHSAISYYGEPRQSCNSLLSNLLFDLNPAPFILAT